MEWNVTMLVVHLIALVLAVLLYRRSPCWLQACVMAALVFTMALAVLAYALALSGAQGWRAWYDLASSIEHLAVLLYLFRIVWQGGLQWRSGRSRSLSS